MPIYPGRRPKTWRVTIFKGKQHEWIVEGTKADARKFEAGKQLALSAQPVTRTRGVLSFADFAQQKYAPHAATHLKASTWNRVRVYQISYLVEFFGDTKLDALRDEHVESFKAVAQERKWRPGYTNTILGVFGTMLKWGRKACGAPIPQLEIKPVPTDKRRVRAWTTEEIGRLYAAAQTEVPWFVSILHFLLDTGCRKGEAIAAQWTWVDWDAGLLRIPVTDEWQPKDKEGRDVPLSDALTRMLRDRPRVSKHIFNSQYKVGYGTFPHDAFWKARDAADLKGGIHTTRHTFASHFLKVQPDLALLAQVLGHSTTYITELYTHLLPEHLNRARNAVQLSPPGAPKRPRKS